MQKRCNGQACLNASSNSNDIVGESEYVPEVLEDDKEMEIQVEQEEEEDDDEQDD